MKELPDIWGNLFRSGVVSGIGSRSATGGLMPGQGGQIDVRKLTPQQYREIRAKNPELLGLDLPKAPLNLSGVRCERSLRRLRVAVTHSACEQSQPISFGEQR